MNTRFTAPLSLFLLFLSPLKIPFLCRMPDCERLDVLLELCRSSVIVVGGFLSVREDGAGWEDWEECLGMVAKGLEQGDVWRRLTCLQTQHTQNDEKHFISRHHRHTYS